MTRLLVIVATLFAFALPLKAQDLPEPINSFVSDFANLLDPETEARITNQLVKIRQDLDLEMTVVTIESRHDYGSFKSIEDFATALFNFWGVGNATRNDGVMVLVARSDRAMRIELGDAYGPIYDDRMGLVIDHHFIPYFRGNEYANGIESGVSEIIKRLRPSYNLEQIKNGGETFSDETFTGPTLWDWIRDRITLFVFIGIAAFAFFEERVRTIFANFQKCPNCNLRQISRSREVLKPASTSESGEERVITVCSNCGYQSEEIRRIPMRSRTRHFSSGRSGGSFGGGSSSGGGASGRW
ncbi:MAG: TPM domain-containing protein [Pseudomonadota bacterium]